jgi:hypothetical protein
VALLAVQDASAGLVPTFTASAATDTVDTSDCGRAGGWDLGVIVIVRNADASSHNVTVDGLALTAVAAGASAVFPIRRKHFGAVCNIVSSAVTSQTVAAVRMSK